VTKTRSAAAVWRSHASTLAAQSRPSRPSPTGVESCTVKPGTKIFVVASSFECSTFEGHGTT
jgi:hypothetical protein